MKTDLCRRIIPCLDVCDGKVVKGVRFKDHVVLGGIVELAQRYSDAGADELVFYDITASAEGRVVDTTWIDAIAQFISIPFCVAGGIRSVEDARRVFHAGADKISINSPAINNPELIDQLAAAFGSQAVVIGIDSQWQDGDYRIWQYTGKASTAKGVGTPTLDWVKEVEARGAGEIVLNCMGADGTKGGYDLEQLQRVRRVTGLPLIASGGAGCLDDFHRAFADAQVDGALAAGIFHRNEMTVAEVKKGLKARGHRIREV